MFSIFLWASHLLSIPHHWADGGEKVTIRYLHENMLESVFFVVMLWTPVFKWRIADLRKVKFAKEVTQYVFGWGIVEMLK